MNFAALRFRCSSGLTLNSDRCCVLLFKARLELSVDVPSCGPSTSSCVNSLLLDDLFAEDHVAFRYDFSISLVRLQPDAGIEHWTQLVSDLVVTAVAHMLLGACDDRLTYLLFVDESLDLFGVVFCDIGD